jgi:hypothetical protein
MFRAFLAALQTFLVALSLGFPIIFRFLTGQLFSYFRRCGRVRLRSDCLFLFTLLFPLLLLPRLAIYIKSFDAEQLQAITVQQVHLSSQVCLHHGAQPPGQVAAAAQVDGALPAQLMGQACAHCVPQQVGYPFLAELLLVSDCPKDKADGSATSRASFRESSSSILSAVFRPLKSNHMVGAVVFRTMAS